MSLGGMDSAQPPVALNFGDVVLAGIVQHGRRRRPGEGGLVGHGNAPVDTSWGAVPDLNGDGYADPAGGASAHQAISI